MMFVDDFWVGVGGYITDMYMYMNRPGMTLFSLLPLSLCLCLSVSLSLHMYEYMSVRFLYMYVCTLSMYV